MKNKSIMVHVRANPLELFYNGTYYDSKEEVWVAMWLEELKGAGFVTNYYKTLESIPLTDPVKIAYTEVKQLKTKIKYTDKEYPLLRGASYTPDFDVFFSAEGIQLLVNYIEPAGSFDKNRVFFSNERLKALLEVKPSFDMQNMERGFVHKQKYLYDKLKIFVNLVEPIALFKKTFLPLQCYNDFKYKKSPTGANKGIKGPGDWKVDFIPRTLNEFLNQH